MSLLFSHLALRPMAFSRRKAYVTQDCLHQFRGLICVYNTLLPLVLCATVSLRLYWEPRSIFCALFRDFSQSSASSIILTLSAILHRQRLNIPDALRVLLNASITCKETHSCDTCDALADPLILVLVRGVDQVMRLQVALEVVGDEVVVAMFGNAAD